MTNPIPHPGKQSAFALLSLADLALTWWLLNQSDGQAYEANPVASWWLARHGWLGLASFKAGVVLVVAGLTALISRSRPRVAGSVLSLGCAALALVVFYSIALCRPTLLSANEKNAERVRATNKDLEEANGETRRASNEALRLLAAVREDLLAGRCTLREAAERVAASEPGKNRAWQQGLANYYPGRTLQERFAACLIGHVVDSQKANPAAAWQAALRLEREFLLTYGSDPPLDHRTFLQGHEPASGEQGSQVGSSPGAPAEPSDATPL